ncbi:DUF2993 domain-containing protein [Thermomicrobiaceae bacterium CFH 74404]|uniref:DUF2993 domain-containing protein n=1 Tax=Thermalbibacter longus TaxID=2951981 RepID=A0AA41WBZ1_9BACT|nr:LmeA family phospholipid-binding protein [Thermalbibacter longus]MCM8750304.1 DUF2993 domain-containing protein [Thermalbibacter longus]
MYCPYCGTRQSPGRRCIACGASFARLPPNRQPRSTTIAQRPRPGTRWERRGGIGGRALGCLMTLVVATLILIALAAFLTSETGSPTTGPPAEQSPPPSPSLTPESRPADTTPTSGSEQVVITEEELNREIAENPRAFGPARNVRAEIDPSGITMRFTAYGLGGAFRARPVARDGTIELEDARVDGPLGLVVDADDLRSRLTTELQRRLASEGVTVEDVTLEQDQLVVTVNRA